MKTSLPTKLTVALVLAVLFLGAELWQTYRSTDYLLSTVEWAERNRSVLTQLNAVLATVESLESLQRAYLLTGQPKHLSDYRSAAARLDAEYEGLRRLVDPLPETRRLVLQLGPLLSERVAALSSVIELYESQGLAAAQARIEEGTGTALMNEIRARLKQIEEYERALLAERVASSQQSSWATERTLLVSALATLLLLLGGVLTIRDLRRRVNVEADLREATARAEEASRARSRFLATVSHEVRTPLNAIIGMTDLLRNSSYNSEQADLTRAVYTNAEALLHLINDLLDSSKIEAEQVDLEHLPLSIRDVVEGVGEILAVRAAAKDVELVTAVEPSVPRRLLGDPNRIWQILMNLAGNAIKFTEDGEVVIRAAARPLEDDPGQVELVLEVSDTGIGIPTKDQERIFERFVQADASTVRRYGGTGLGLSIARSLVELMGGRLELESTEGKGSTFRVALPMEVYEGGGGGEEPGDALAGLHVLVAIPHVRSREAVRETITGAGATVVASADGAEVFADGAPPWDVVVAAQDPAELVEARIAEAAARGTQALGVVYLVAVESPNFRRRPAPGARVEYVFKPAKQGRLIEAVLAAAGRPSLAPSRGDRQALLPAGGGGGRQRPGILIAEDNPDNWSLLVRILTNGGYKVDLAENGLEAVEHVRRSRYDLVLMDLEMPVMDGFEATKRIRELEEQEQRVWLPIVALTAHAVEGFRERCVESGMDDYATKPIKQQALLELVRRWVDPRPLVLLADDSPDSVLVVRKFLESLPVRLLTVGNGKEALEAFRWHRVSLVLLDMDMPVMDGYTAAREIRKMPEGRTVPLLAMTGYDGPDERQKCLQAGCSGHLAKPLRRIVLVRAVREALGPLLDTAPAPDRDAPPPIPVTPPDPETGSPSPRPETLSSELLGRLGLVRRLIEQRRMETAAERVRALQEAFDAPGLLEGAPEILRLTDELLRALEEDHETSAAFWADRLGDALREAGRLAVLRRAEVLTASPNPTLDRLTRLASKVLHTPVSLISFVGEHGQFFASQRGLGEPWASRRGTPLSHSFCKHVVQSGEPLVVEDARTNPLVSSNLAIKELNVIAYAGCPLVTKDGHVLGSMCVIDDHPRVWTDEDLATVNDIAALAIREIETQVSMGAEPPASAPRPGDYDADRPGTPAFRARFVEARRLDAERARELLATRSFSEIARLGHQWKGSSAMLGSPEVGKIGSELERAAQGEDRVRIEVALDLLDEYLDRASSDAPNPGGT
jgi:signal transduction histidine kinase/CheY-like chemotaxis protein/GAF domain-containing protein